MGNLGSDALGQFRKATVNIKEWTRQDCLAHLLIGEVWFGSGQSNMEMPLRVSVPYRGRKPRYPTSGKGISIRYATIQLGPEPWNRKIIGRGGREWKV